MSGYLENQYHETIARVRALDPNVQVGMASSHEIARLNGIAESLEQKRASAPPTSYDVLNRSLHGYWASYHKARQEITELQATMTRDLRTYREIGTPPEFFEVPEPIGSECPSFSGDAARLGVYIEQFGRRTIELQARAQAITAHVREFERLGPVERLQRVVRQLSARVEQVESLERTVRELRDRIAQLEAAGAVPKAGGRNGGKKT